MNCKNYRNNLIGFIKGQLSKDEEVRIREHLGGCEECRAFADYLRATMSIIEMEKRIEPDPFLATRIEGILQASSAPKYETSRKARFITVLSFSVFILAGAFGGFGLGKLISPRSNANELAANEIMLMIDDMRHEPIEAYLLELEQ
jgi:predicted anti-sigma-YlaC factor YlaD